MPCSEHSGFACCAHVLRCARIRWLKASLLEPARSREGSGLFAAQIRQPSRERCSAIAKAVEHAFPSLLGWCGILCAAPSQVLLPHEGWCWKQRSGRNRSGEALALAFAPGFRPLSVLYNHRNPGATAIGRMIRSRSGLTKAPTFLLFP